MEFSFEKRGDVKGGGDGTNTGQRRATTMRERLRLAVRALAEVFLGDTCRKKKGEGLCGCAGEGMCSSAFSRSSL